MGRKIGDVQQNFVVSEELDEKIRSAAQKQGLSVAAFLRAAASKAIVDDFKSVIPDQADDIDIFETNLENIRVSYQQALKASKDAYEIAANKVRGELQALENLTQRNSELEAQRLSDQEKIAELQKQLEAAGKDLERVKDLQDENKKLRADLESARDRNADLTDRIADEARAHAEEIKKLQDENFQRVLEIIKAGKQQA